ncbi:MAG: alcohol dehydrogenase catalytic domain-containing protein [Acidimicrobiia bacterium]|nr:alcohol dehydrogenase catalytic domain-containing protein [Acidimicrobiia bacterium]
MGDAEALVLDEPKRLARRAFTMPEVGEDDGILRVEACGLCGTDHEQWSGHIAAAYPYIPGHEIVGVVDQVGPAAAERWGVQVGDRVAVEVFMSCRTCPACEAGEYRRCQRHGVRHFYGFISSEEAPGLWGGYATHLYLHPDALLLPIPAGLDPAVATAFNPLGAGIRWGVTVPRLEAGEVVAVLGPGIRGLSVAAAAKAAGAAFVLMTGLGPRDAPRLELASSFGVDLAVDVATTDPVRALRQAGYRGADVVVDVTAKAPAAFAQAVKLAGTGARVVLAGTRGAGSGAPGFEPDHIVYKELTVHGTLGVDYPAYQEALQLLASGRFPFAELPRETVGLGGAPDLIARLAGEAPGDVPVHGVVAPGR